LIEENDTNPQRRKRRKYSPDDAKRDMIQKKIKKKWERQSKIRKNRKYRN
jgi:hypothetical protein